MAVPVPDMADPEPAADDDVSDAQWVPLDTIEDRGLWSETVRVIREAEKMRDGG